mmetsp:Transcript_50022/g.126085  ORF Transcript_50022/g.126085 Transcript_50022/m.126085 type:complete len:200 (+) Transcript_50022:568-1167(+)
MHALVQKRLRGPHLHFQPQDAGDAKLVSRAVCPRHHLVLEVPHGAFQVSGVDVLEFVLRIALAPVHVESQNLTTARARQSWRWRWCWRGSCRRGCRRRRWSGSWPWAALRGRCWSRDFPRRQSDLAASPRRAPLRGVVRMDARLATLQADCNCIIFGIACRSLVAAHWVLHTIVRVGCRATGYRRRCIGRRGGRCGSWC